MAPIEHKFQRLKETLSGFKRVLIAFSGGVDSTFLLKTAVDTLGKENVLACIGVSPSLSAFQHQQARDLASQFGVCLEEIPVGEINDPSYRANGADRCFHCKSRLYRLLNEKALQNQIQHVLCGANSDDKDDYRPGNRAAEVFGILSPMMNIGLTKAEIRELSRNLGLSTADIPASPCLASRVAYGLEITPEKLTQVEQAETCMRELGFVEFRVRHHGDIARIEVKPEDMPKLTEPPLRKQIIESFKKIGFLYISLDLQGFRSGSMNETLSNVEKM